jgi:hypothetical protein
MSSDYQALALVQKEINKLKQDRELFIAAGRADSYENYQHVCGVILGLNYADNIINDLVRKMNNDDDV